jgi:hypothetical protein
MTITPKAYESRRSNRPRRPVVSTNTGAAAETAITSVSGISESAEGELSGCCEVTRRA